MTKKQKPKTAIHSGEFSMASAITICETCGQAFPHDCIYCGKGIRTDQDFYCGDVDRHDEGFPEHVCNKCGDKYFDSEDM